MRNYIPSLETRNKISKTMKERGLRPKITPESIEKMRATKTGKKHGPMTAETKAKIGLKNKIIRTGSKLSPSHCENIRKSLTGILRTKKVKICPFCGKDFMGYDYRKFCSRDCADKASIGRVSHNKGKKLQDEGLRQKFRENAMNTLKKLGKNKISEAERIVHAWLERNEIVFIPQFRYKLGVADFCIPDKKIIIECYGSYWHSLPNYVERDKKKNQWLRDNGYRVIILNSEDVVKNKHQLDLTKEWNSDNDFIPPICIDLSKQFTDVGWQN